MSLGQTLVNTVATVWVCKLQCAGWWSHRSDKARMLEWLMCTCFGLSWLRPKQVKNFCFNDDGRRHFLQQGNHTLEGWKLIFPACSSWTKLCTIFRCSGRCAAYLIFIYFHVFIYAEHFQVKIIEVDGMVYFIWCRYQMDTMSPIQY